MSSPEHNQNARKPRRQLAAVVAPEDRPPAPADARAVPSSDGWAYVPGRGIWRYDSQANEWLPKLGWCPRVIDDVRYSTLDGETINRRIRIDVQGQQEVISAGDIVRGNAWHRFDAARGFSGRTVADVLTNIVFDQAAGMESIPGYPYFADGRLVLPPSEYLPDGYLNREQSPAALAALTALVRAIAPYPLAAAELALAAGAPWVSALELQPGTFGVLGPSTVAKSTGLYAAASLWGVAYRRVAPPWAGTKLGLPGSLRDLGVLPAFRDELGAAGLSPADRAHLFTVIMEGARRMGRTREDFPRPSASWSSWCFSTSNIAHVPAHVASAGTAKGVIEIHADAARPVIPAAAKKEIIRLTNHPDMPGAWTGYATALELADVRDRYDLAAKTLVEPDADGLAYHMHRAMSLAVAFGGILADLTGVTEFAASVEQAAREIIDGTAEREAEIGADHTARLTDTVTEYLTKRPDAFGRRDGYGNTRGDQMGFWVTAEDGTRLLCVLPTAHKEIAAAADVEDVKTALRQLRDRGQLRVTKDKGLRYMAHVPGTTERATPVYAYALDLLPEPPPPPDKPPASDPAPGAAAPAQEEPEELPPLPPEPPPEPDYSDWGPGTVGAAVNGVPEPDSPPAPAPGNQPAPPLRAAESRSAPRQGREALPLAQRIADFAKPARLRFPDASDADVEAALHIYERSLNGLRFECSPGITGILLFRKLQGHPAVPELDRVNVLDLCGDRQHHPNALRIRRGFSTLDPAAAGPDDGWICGLDVNAQYLGAGVSTELGCGQPERTGQFRPEQARLPGYVLADWSGFPAPFTAIRPGEWLPMPMAKLALDWADAGRCPAPVISEAIIWPKHRRWFRLLCRDLGTARAQLLDRPELPARIALAVVKLTYSTTLGGMVRSERHNRTAMLRPDWGDMVRAHAAANMWRSITRATRAPFLVADPDAAYWTMAAADQRPDGLTYSGQPGKWKTARACPLTPEIRAAIEANRPPMTVRDLIIAGERSQS